MSVRHQNQRADHFESTKRQKDKYNQHIAPFGAVCVCKTLCSKGLCETCIFISKAAAWEPWIVESHAMKLVDNLWQDIANEQNATDVATSG